MQINTFPNQGDTNMASEEGGVSYVLGFSVSFVTSQRKVKGAFSEMVAFPGSNLNEVQFGKAHSRHNKRFC